MTWTVVRDDHRIDIQETRVEAVRTLREEAIEAGYDEEDVKDEVEEGGEVRLYGNNLPDLVLEEQ